MYASTLSGWRDGSTAIAITTALPARNIASTSRKNGVPGMPIAKVSESGDSQMVHLPEEFHFAGDEVEIFRRGDEIVLREKPPQEKSTQEKPEDTPSQEREGL
jgi:antitoxin VapB